MKNLVTLFFAINLISAVGQTMDTAKWTIQILGTDTFFIARPSKGDLFRKDGDISSAIKEYKKIYEKDKNDIPNCYNLACGYAINNQIDTAFIFLKYAIRTDSTISCLIDPDFIQLSNDKRWQEIEKKQIEKSEVKYGKYKNIDLSKKLWNMHMKDQAYYYHIDIAEQKVGLSSPIIIALWNLKKILNEKNLKDLIEIIEYRGWPKISEVGNEAGNAAFLVIQHSDLETQKKYLPIMKEAADKGEALWSSLALLIDRVNLEEGKKQIYGSQLYTDENGKYYVNDLEEPEYVNQRRKSIGLESIEEYVSKWGIIWTVQQKEK